MIIIEDVWDEEDDIELLNYFSDKKILSRDEILKIPLKDITCLFADCYTTNEYLKKNNKYVNYDTYPSGFTYKRKIEMLEIEEIKKLNFPYFVKSVEHKELNGLVVRDKYDLVHVQEANCKLFVSECVNFLNEFRIFYEKGKIHGIQESTDFIIGSSGIKMNPPIEFIKECTDMLDKMDGTTFVLDIGYISDRGWAVVELNPPYSLSSYDLDIKKYVDFCQIFWNNLKEEEIISSI